jgi:hypothetical protein
LNIEKNYTEHLLVVLQLPAKPNFIGLKAGISNGIEGVGGVNMVDASLDNTQPTNPQTYGGNKHHNFA